MYMANSVGDKMSPSPTLFEIVKKLDVDSPQCRSVAVGAKIQYYEQLGVECHYQTVL